MQNPYCFLVLILENIFITSILKKCCHYKLWFLAFGGEKCFTSTTHQEHVKCCITECIVMPFTCWDKKLHLAEVCETLTRSCTPESGVNRSPIKAFMGNPIIIAADYRSTAA